MSSKVAKLITKLDHHFPFKKAEEWDKVGHFLGDKEKELHNVVVALDLTKDVLDRAVEVKAEAIIVHHPVVFNDVKNVEFAQYPYKKSLINRLKNTEINVIVLHTNFDEDKEGMVKAVAKPFGKPIMGKAKYGFFIEKEMKFSEVAEILKENLHAPIMSKYLTHEYSVYKKIAILPGAGDILDIVSMHNEGADLIITSDIKWSTWVAAKEMGMNLVQIPHSIERAFIHHVALLVKKDFKDVKVTEIYPTIF